MKIDTFKDNMTRQVDEGRRQVIMEDLQSRNKIICLNSKLDFIQPFKIHLQVQKGNRNIAPGQPERKQGPKGHFLGPPTYDNEGRSQKRKFEEVGRQKEDNLPTNNLKRRRLLEADSTLDFIDNINRERCSTPNPESNSVTDTQTNKKRKRELDASELDSFN